MIKKKGKGYVAASKSGKELSKKVQTKEESKKQIAAVEISKKKRGKK